MEEYRHNHHKLSDIKIRIQQKREYIYDVNSTGKFLVKPDEPLTIQLWPDIGRGERPYVITFIGLIKIIEGTYNQIFYSDIEKFMWPNQILWVDLLKIEKKNLESGSELLFQMGVERQDSDEKLRFSSVENRYIYVKKENIDEKVLHWNLGYLKKISSQRI